MFDWLRRRRAAPIPDALWSGALHDYPFIARLPPADRERLRELAAGFIATKEFHGANGFVITDDVAVHVAAQAVLPVLHLGLGWYDDFVGIVIQPGEVVAKREALDDDGVMHLYDEHLVGEAMDLGPVMLSWQDVARAGESAREGYNVVIHEFAHKIDMRDGAADGCPPLRSLDQRKAWLAVIEPAWHAFREKVIVAERFGGEPTWLDPYGAENISEFFAVACEAYFVNRAQFGHEFPELVPLFDGFFRPKP